MRILCALLFAFSLGVICSEYAHAEPIAPSLLGMASLVSVNPSALGVEGGTSLLFQPLSDHELMVGPKVSVLVAIASQSTRLDLNLGVDETLWLVNMFGPGMALDLVAPSTMGGEGVSVHFRIEPNFAVRVKRLGDVGALAVRIGVPYDSHYQWGLQLGVTLQMKGVPGFTEAAE